MTYAKPQTAPLAPIAAPAAPMPPVAITPDVGTLLAMLAWRRPDSSKTERNWIRTYLEPLGVKPDAAGNLILRIGDSPTVLWSAHTDTVHRTGGRQRLRFARGIVTLDSSEKESNCLGADNTAGCWLLREMILAKRPGLYVFHRGEEVGGRGSGEIADTTPELLDGIGAAVAFDRRNTHSIITHQWTGRTASDAFAESLATALDLDHKPDSGGTFTDTANYIDLVGECSNISAGFYNEHTAKESLDVAYLLRLRDALLRLDVAELVFERKPGDADPDEKGWLDYVLPDKRFRGEQLGGWGNGEAWDEYRDSEPRTVRGMLREYPEECAAYLEDLGVTAEALLRAVDDYRYGPVTRGAFKRRYD